MKAKLLSFLFIYFSESGLFNELRPIQIKKFPQPPPGKKSQTSRLISITVAAWAVLPVGTVISGIVFFRNKLQSVVSRRPWPPCLSAARAATTAAPCRQRLTRGCDAVDVGVS
jgi:hypothetical protein